MQCERKGERCLRSDFTKKCVHHTLYPPSSGTQGRQRSRDASARIQESILVLPTAERQTLDVPGKVYWALLRTQRDKAVLVCGYGTQERLEGRIRATGVQAHGVLSPFFHHSSQNKVLAEGSRVKAVSKDTRIKSKHGQALLFSMHLIILFLQLPSPQSSFSICQSNCLATEQIRERICSIEEETNKPFTVHPQSDRRWSPLPHLRHQPIPDSHHKSKSTVEFPSEFRHLSQELTQT